MLARVERHLAAPRAALGPEQALGVLRDGLGALRAEGVEAPDPGAAIAVLSEADMPLLDAFAEADSPFHRLTDSASERAFAATGEVGQAAFHFLGEPLYRLADDVTVATWASWPLCAARPGSDPLEPAWRLSRGGWSPGWSDGVFLFDRRREFGLV